MGEDPEAVLRGGPSDQRRQAEAVFRQGCSFRRWPSIPIPSSSQQMIASFPFEFQKRVARDRLKIDPEARRGGHLVALSNPQGLADLLLRLEREDSEAK